MKKVIATAVTIGAVVSTVGLGSAFAQTATPTVTPTTTPSATTTTTPTPTSSVTVPSGAPATGHGAN